MKTDPSRWEDREYWEYLYGCGVYVRAKTPEGWGSVDICLLDRQSLEKWLQSLGKESLIRLVLLLEGHKG